MPLDPRKCKSYHRQAGGESLLAPRLHHITVEIVFSPAETSKPKHREWLTTVHSTYPILKRITRRPNHMATVMCKKVVGLLLF